LNRLMSRAPRVGAWRNRNREQANGLLFFCSNIRSVFREAWFLENDTVENTNIDLLRIRTRVASSLRRA
jgi:hypothetical protein